MIFIVDSQGTTKAALYEPIYQGSNSANRIVLLAPFPNSSQCVAHFCLPNGITLEPVYLNTFANDVLETEKLNGWYRNIEYPITQYAGTVDVQFEITTTNGTIMSELTSFEVRKGNFKTPEVTEESISLYREILNAVTLYNGTTEEAIEEVNNSIEEINSKTNNTDSRVGGLESEISIINSQVVPDIKINHITLTDDDNLNIFNQKGNKIASIYLPYERWKATAKHIALSLDENYVLTISILTDTHEVISSSSIDLPIESMIIGASYENGVLTLQLKNNEDGSLGNTIQVNISDLISGLVNETDFESFQNDINGEISNLQDRVSDLEQNGGNGNITVEQEVNDSTNPVSSKAVQNEFQKFAEAYDDRVNELVVKQENFYNGDLLSVKHNFDYHSNKDISNLTIIIPSSEILCSIMFKTADSGSVTIKIDGVKGYVGKAPDLEENGVTWELSIHNGIIAAGKVVSEE
jgi:hypothetical protein